MKTLSSSTAAIGLAALLFGGLSLAEENRYLVPPANSSGTDLLEKPDGAFTRLCTPERNARVLLLENEETGLALRWAKVEILEGACASKTGWVAGGHISMRPCG